MNSRRRAFASRLMKERNFCRQVIIPGLKVRTGGSESPGIIKEINISKEIINKTRGAVAPHTPLRGEQQATSVWTAVLGWDLVEQKETLGSDPIKTISV